MQQYLSIDFLILYALLGITLFIGLRTGRGIKDIKEYAIGNKTFTTGALVLTLLATDMSGEPILDITQYTRTRGIIQFVAYAGWGIAYLMQGLIFAPKFLNFPHCMTIGDVMGTLYKGPAKVVTGVLASITAMCIMVMEITILGLFSETLLGIDFYWGIAVGGSALVLYTAHGGIKSVTYTDMFQFVVLAAIVPIIAVVALQHAGGIEEVLTHIPYTHTRIVTHPKFYGSLMICVLTGFFQFDIMFPTSIQRILMAKTKQQVRHQFLIASAVIFTLVITLILLGLTSIILFPSDEGIPYIFPHMIHQLLPVGLKGLAFAGLFAIVMSTFDSFLHAAGLTIVHDVVTPIYNNVTNGKTFNELKVTRWVTIVLGSIAILIGLLGVEELSGFMDLAHLYNISYLFTGPLLAFPLFAGVMGLKPDKYALYIASIVTILILIFTKCFIPEQQQRLATIISVCVNGTLFLGIHAIRNKGFSIINYEANTTYVVKPDPKTWKNRLKPYLPTPKNIFNLSTREVNRLGAPHILVGIFGMLNYLLPAYMWEHHTVEGANLMLYLRALAVLACIFLILKDQWSNRLSHYFPLFWHATLCFFLPFLNTFMLLMTNVSVSWLVNIAMSIVLLIMLVDWTMFLILSAIGISAGFLFYSQFVGPIQVDMDFSSGYFLTYQILFSLLICGLFITKGHRRYALLAAEKQQAEKKEKNNLEKYRTAYREKMDMVRELRNGQIDDMPDVMRGIQSVKAQLQSNDPLDREALTRIIKEVDKKLTPISFTIVGLDHRALDYLRLPVVGSIDIKTLITTLQREIPQLKINYLGNTKKETITCGIMQLQSVLKNTAQVLESKTKEVFLTIEDTLLAYPAPNVKPNHVKKIAALRFAFTHDANLLPRVDCKYDVNMSDSVIPATDCNDSILLASNHRIIRAHYGYSNVDISHTTDYDCYTYVFPADVEDVRPRDMNSPVMELGAALVRANDKYPGAKEQEEEFLRELATKTSVNMETVVDTIELIKWYHGSVMRRSGEPFYLHPLAVARIALDWTTDEDIILGALLHDTVEDTRMLLEQIDMKYGPDVRSIVDCVTHFESYKDSFYQIRP